ncbi:SCY1 protein kinase [Colletotrichum tofieldiae]|uniref:Inactive serine/threonine-protein kinase scy1 n=2 Tax=Colletotrichum spaethianum species complex TaxID=2707349 RepID=A0AA37GZH0_9PEZI|nr:putative inactive serine/threonine-protein kinase scy1 [Colletotrichum liriopes]GKT60528.1 SCY1 protein kinase [Colletotrichum tofieldiae]GKT68233.1 SCY1 protein kinase [Colletotrichum tofieldiae]
MNFLKSAVASAIAQGPPFPYSFGDKVDIDESIWTLNNGTKREDGSNCSIFSFDVAANKSRLPLAKNALRKLRTLRHPGVIKVLDTVETDTYIYIATERVVPLRWHVKRKSLTPETIKWGLSSVAALTVVQRTIKFINDEASSIHGNLRVGSVYTSESGEWKMSGFEVLSNVKDDEAVIYTYGSLVPDSGRYAPPELARGGWDAIKKSPHSAVDSFGFGCLIFEVFNGDFMGSDQAGQTKNIPPTMQQSYKRLVNPNPKARVSVGHFLEQGQRSGSFFDSPLIKLTEGIENLGVKTETEREQFLDDLDQLTDDFPEDFFKMKVLPELIKSVEFGGGGPKAFSVVMKIAAKLPSEDFDSKITPVVIRLFSNPDRAIRVCLLDSLPLMIDRLTQKTVNDKIFPQLVTGFTDIAPVVREQTLKSVLVIISKLSDRTINGDLLKYLAKTANDEQPGIRTNTTICLGKIAKNLGTSSRSKVLIAAFTRSLRDPFVHARNASLMALGVTGDCFSDEDVALRIMPAVCPLLIDKEKVIRDQASKTMDVYMQKVRKAAASMPDSALPPQGAEGPGGPRMSTPQPNEASASSWAGWAISSFTNKLSTAAGEMQTSNGSGTASPRPTPSPGPDARRPTTSSASALHRQAVTSPPPPMSRTPSSVVADAFNPEPADDGGDAWGDLADDDAWGEPTGSTKSSTAKKETTASATPFDDGAEPDFAGWLAAQSQKKGGSSKPLPKGLAKASTTTAKKPLAAKPAAKPVVAKKIDMKPKQAEDDDDGWGDGW